MDVLRPAVSTSPSIRAITGLLVFAVILLALKRQPQAEEPGDLNLLAQDKVRLSLPHLTLAVWCKSDRQRYSTTAFYRWPAAHPCFGPIASQMDARFPWCRRPIGEACPWCFRRPSLHRLCGLERPLRVKFAPFTHFTSDLRGMIGNPVDSTCLRVAPDPAIRGSELDRTAVTDDQR